MTIIYDPVHNRESLQQEYNFIYCKEVYNERNIRQEERNDDKRRKK